MWFGRVMPRTGRNKGLSVRENTYARTPRGFADAATFKPITPGDADLLEETVYDRTGAVLRHGDAARSPEPAAAPTLPFVSTGPHGHRARMREKLLERGPDALADYELLEMLLFFAQPKGDTKPLAKAVINRFGSFGAALAAPQKELFATPGLGTA